MPPLSSVRFQAWPDLHEQKALVRAYGWEGLHGGDTDERVTLAQELEDSTPGHLELSPESAELLLAYLDTDGGFPELAHRLERHLL